MTRREPREQFGVGRTKKDRPALEGQAHDSKPEQTQRSRPLRFYSMLRSLIVLSLLVVGCDSDTSSPNTPDTESPETVRAILASCDGSEFDGPALYSGTVETSVFQCIINRLRDHGQAQEIYGKLLFNAIWATNLEAVTLLLDTNMNVNTVDLFGTPFLDHAVGNIGAVKHDVSRGEKPERTYDRAVSIGRMLVARGARIANPYDYEDPWFHSLDTFDVVEIMIDADMDVNIRRALETDSFNPITALVPAVSLACSRDDEESREDGTKTVKALIDAGADVNTMSFGRILGQDENGRYSLIIGIFEVRSVLDSARDAREPCPAVVEMLVEAGACEDLEGRRFEWGVGRGLDFILTFLQEVGRLYEPRDVDC